MSLFTSRRGTRSGLAVAAVLAAIAAATLTGIGTGPAAAASGGAAIRPIMGWSSWSFLRSTGTQTSILAQADAMHASLESHGYRYINIDAGWSDHVDGFGRDQPNATKYPDGIPALAAKLHKMGLKLGLYMNPGIRQSVVAANLPIFGTHLHAQDIADTTQNGNTLGSGYDRIDYTKPGAQQYVQSIVDMFASWGVDYVKMDFVGPGGGNVPADNRPDVEAWHKAIVHNGRPIVLELSNSLSLANAATWKEFANGWRIEGDIECYHCGAPGSSYPLTSWAKASKRFADLPQWTPFAGRGGWNDLDSLELGNGDNDGLTVDQRQSVMTLWAIGCAPLLLGSDLTHLDPVDLPIMTNDEVIAVNQAARPGKLVVGTPTGTTQVWSAKEPNGSYAVALFNLGTTATTVSVTWQQLGFNRPAKARDLWTHSSLGTLATGFSATIAPGATRFLTVSPR